jgi:hypothetical protein
VRYRGWFRANKTASRSGEVLQKEDHSPQIFGFGQWLRIVFQARIPVSDAPDRNVAYSVGLSGELGVDWPDPRGEIVQIVRTAERLTRKHEQCLDKLSAACCT